MLFSDWLLCAAPGSAGYSYNLQMPIGIAAKKGGEGHLDLTVPLSNGKDWLGKNKYSEKG